MIINREQVLDHRATLQWRLARVSDSPVSQRHRPSAGRPRQLILDTAAWMLLDDAGEVSSLEDVQRAL
jgi:hypothetical protein